MSFQVYNIRTYSVGSNSHGVCREENWGRKLFAITETEEQARYIVMENSRHLPYFVNLAYGTEGEQREQILETFCFDDKYIIHNRFFVGNDRVKQLKQSLKEEGIHVIQE